MSRQDRPGAALNAWPAGAQPARLPWQRGCRGRGQASSLSRASLQRAAVQHLLRARHRPARDTRGAPCLPACPLRLLLAPASLACASLKRPRPLPAGLAPLVPPPTALLQTGSQQVPRRCVGCLPPCPRTLLRGSTPCVIPGHVGRTAGQQPLCGGAPGLRDSGVAV